MRVCLSGQILIYYNGVVGRSQKIIRSVHYDIIISEKSFSLPFTITNFLRHVSRKT